MAYAKPEVLAQNAAQGSFAAGCPAQNSGGPIGPQGCKNCERTY